MRLQHPVDEKVLDYKAIVVFCESFLISKTFTISRNIYAMYLLYKFVKYLCSILCCNI